MYPTRDTSHVPALRRWLSIAVLAALLATLVAAPAGAVSPPPLGQTVKDADADIIAQLMAKTSASDPRYLSGNVWYDGSPDCFRCTLGPSLLLAAYSTSAGLGDQSVQTVTATFDKAIHDHQRADGAFGPPGSGESSPDIQTVFFANELAETYLMLGLSLDIAHKMQWSSALTKSADWLIRNGNTTYYTNGNINLAVAVNLDLTYRITNLTRFQTAAAAALDFALSPPQNRWPGFGLQYTKQPTLADGSDGAGYLAEKGTGKPGYDPGYSSFQLDIASMWFLLTGDANAKRITNLLFNQLIQRVRVSDWTLDVSHGSRKTAANARYGFTMSALTVLYYKGGRSDLGGLVESQTKYVLASFKSATTFAHAGYSYSFGLELGAVTYAITSTLFG